MYVSFFFIKLLYNAFKNKIKNIKFVSTVPKKSDIFLLDSINF